MKPMVLYTPRNNIYMMRAGGVNTRLTHIKGA